MLVSAHGRLARETHTMNDEGTLDGFWWRKIAGLSRVWELSSAEEDNWQGYHLPDKKLRCNFRVASPQGSMPKLSGMRSGERGPHFTGAAMWRIRKAGTREVPSMMAQRVSSAASDEVKVMGYFRG